MPTLTAATYKITRVILSATATVVHMNVDYPEAGIMSFVTRHKRVIMIVAYFMFNNIVR